MCHYRDKKNSNKSSKTHAFTTQSSHFAKHDLNVKGYTCKKVSHKVKVSVPKNSIKCTNRFHILQESDGVVSGPLYDLESTSFDGIEHITVQFLF